jgi:hypothetical protein
MRKEKKKNVLNTKTKSSQLLLYAAAVNVPVKLKIVENS